MASPLHIRDRRRIRRSGGFTLLEVMMVTFISSFVFAGVLSAYVFLGRGLARQINEQSLESRTRLALYWFTQDVSTATSIIAQNPGTNTSGVQMTLSVPGVGLVYYMTDWSAGAGAGVLERQVGSGPVLTLLTNLTSLSLGYYDSGNNAVVAPTTAPTVPQVDIKQVCLTYTSTAGVASAGAQSNLTVVSPRVVMKNKMYLTDPNDP